MIGHLVIGDFDHLFFFVFGEGVSPPRRPANGANGTPADLPAADALTTASRLKTLIPAGRRSHGPASKGSRPPGWVPKGHRRAGRDAVAEPERPANALTGAPRRALASIAARLDPWAYAAGRSSPLSPFSGRAGCSG